MQSGLLLRPRCRRFKSDWTGAEITAAALVVEGSLLTPVLSSSLTRERPRIAEDG
ncbi:hypothetical protein RBSH_04243 [Rhodopirellula baltica SH28]|uniref:Uncharacterized protein n=1 Tax=Rhodopirellula baltica SH28 TaxID=993517 RepID=K5E3Z7_RHOBT|nr:hypothetical protein RBSH_04243 [Rhodopirellula baltica SH28]